MGSRLRKMIFETGLFWLFFIGSSLSACLYSERGEDQPAGAALAASLALPLVIASWVLADARQRGKTLYYDYDSFVFFAWPIFGPCYLFQTRGVRAFITMLCFGGIYLTSSVLGYLLSRVINHLVR